MPSPDPRLIAALDAHRAGRFAEAETGYRAALAADPAQTGALHLLGVLLHQTGRSTEGAESIARAIALKDDVPDFHSNYGLALLGADDPGGAEVAFRRALALDPSRPAFHHNLGQALDALCRPSAAQAAWRAALERDPDFVPALNNLGAALIEAGRPGDAEPLLRRAVAVAPDDPNPAMNLANALRDLRRAGAAEAAFRRSAALPGAEAGSALGLGSALCAQGRVEDAIDTYRAALARAPDDAELWDNYLFALNYHPTLPADEVARAYRAWGENLRAATGPAVPPPARSLPAGRKLRVGYVSPDFRDHALRRFVEPVFERHDRTAFEIFAYSQTRAEDAVTERFRALADRFVPTAALDDAALDARIRADGIDVLVDLAGHSAGNRLGVFARKPARVQVSWLGYACTTGLDAVDWFLCDESLVPRDAEGNLVEKPYRLPVFAAYRPPAEEPPGTGARDAGVAFVSLTRAIRINDRVVRTWARLLREIPDATLRLDSASFDDPATREATARRFAAHGVEPSRLSMGFASPPWATLRAADLALDCFPHNSGTTLFDGLCMGVPFVTLSDRPPVGRLGSAIATALGAPEWIARDEDEYVAIAKRLSADRGALTRLRAELPGRMRASPLCDEAGFVRALEAAYRAMSEADARSNATA
jgi:protein O-GlcNAc transferase